MSTHTWDVIVVGGGAAGLSAALMLGRARRRVLVLDAGSPRNRFAAHMHGVLGNDGASPLEFLARAREEVAVYGVEIRSGSVASVTESAVTESDVTESNGTGTESALLVRTDAGDEYTTRRLVAASGAWDDLPPIPGFAERWGTDLLHCPYCHGWEVRGKRLAVIATSPVAIHQAQLVRQWSDDVVFFTAAAGPIDEAVATALAARNVVMDARPVRELVIEGDRVVGIRVEGGDLDDGTNVVPVDAAFTAGTLRPNDGYLSSLALERSETMVGDFITADGAGRTSNGRVFAVGNITMPNATVPVAIAAGAMAGGMANMDLVTEDFALAVAASVTQVEAATRV